MNRKKFLKYPIENNMEYPGRIRFTPIITKPVNLGGRNALDLIKKMSSSYLKTREKVVGGVSAGASEFIGPIYLGNSNITELEKASTAELNAINAMSLNPDDKDLIEKEVVTKGDTTVQMYLPQNIVIPDSLTYENANLNAGGQITLSSIQQGSGIAGAIGSAVGEGIGTIKELLTGSGIKDEVAQLTAARVAANTPFLGDDYRSAIRIGLQARLNPNTKANFRSVNLREFSFTFKFIGTSQRESREIKDIIKFFRLEAYPDHITPRNMVPNEAGVNTQNPLADIPIGFKYPNKFQINMEARQSNGQFKPYATKIKPCYLRNITTTYNPTGMSIHEDGEPFEIDMSLTFQEFATLSKKDIEEGF
tara:strand:- start:2217 stop:3308 length:1092 start_codon:yes stop_codon:yes gene_type:complete